MANRLSKFGSYVLLLTCVAIIATGCGRRGALEAPASTAIIDIDEDGNERTTTEEVKEDKPFFLDGLL